MMHKVFAFLLVLGCAWGLSNCGDTITANQTPVPSVPVNLTINTDLPSYYYLKSPGTWLYLEGGNRGVVLVHNFDDEFYAFDRTCSYQPDLSCSQVFIDSTGYFFKCGEQVGDTFIKCCDSQFQLNGIVNGGPARFPLRPFAIRFSGANIYINN